MEDLFKKRYKAREEEYEQFREIVTVFSSVSNEAPDEFKHVCQTLGEQLSKENYKISYGGSPNGCNKWLIDGVVASKKGDVRAVKYSAWGVNHRVENPTEELRAEIVKTEGPDLFMRMTELRRDAMACVVLPGGTSTMEELWNAVEGAAEFKPIPVVILNLNGFYDPVKDQMDRMADYFYWPRYKKYVLFAESVPEVIRILNTLRYMKYLEMEQKPYKINAKRQSRRIKKRKVQTRRR